jgi:hypothetical protein
MKTIINSFCSFLEAFGQARYAAFLTRQGKVDEARALYE